MKLARQSLDVGLFTNNVAAMRRFYEEEIGLAFEEVLPTGGGARQHRLGLNGSVLKLNEARTAFPEGQPSGYQKLSISTEKVAAPTDLADPDGNAVRLLPADGQEPWIEVDIAVADIAAATRHYRDALGFEPVEPGVFRCGTTLVRLVSRPGQPATGELRAAGFRYLTVQVWDADAEYAHALAHGANGAAPPRTSGNVARFGFVRDPGGNWLEISQRASLTGPLPPNEPV